MGRAAAAKEEHRWFRKPSLQERADMAQAMQMDTLWVCPDPWALRHTWTNVETGEVQRARCNRWECPYCGPRKVDLWRRLVKQAEPVLFLTLTKAGKTVEQARRALTTFMQALRRGSKGRGPNHIGARQAYPVEYFGVLEMHHDFERNGFHWHLLLRGVDYISYQEVIRPLWTSATRGQVQEEEAEEWRSGPMIETVEEQIGGQKVLKKHFRIGWVTRIRNVRAIGYVTKYLMKTLSTRERGTRLVPREQTVVGEDEQGNVVVQRQVEMVEVASKAHRICYSRYFFPDRVAELRRRLFAGMPDGGMEQGNGKPIEEKVEKKPSPWRLVPRVESDEVEEYRRDRLGEVAEELQETRGVDVDQYEQRRRELVLSVEGEVRSMRRGVYWKRRRRCLEEALEDQRPLSRRVISIWDYQRKLAGMVG